MPQEHSRPPAHDVDEHELLQQLLLGTQQAYRQAVNRYSGAMLVVARAVIGDNDAEDVVQEAWLSALRALPEFEQRSSLKTWLISITVNKAKNRLRGRRVEVSLNVEDPDSLPLADRFASDGHWRKPLAVWHEHSPEALLQAEGLRDCFDKHLALLPEAQRLVLNMRDLQGLGQEDICRIVGVSLTNMRVLLHRARLRLLEMVDHYEETGEC